MLARASTTCSLGRRARHPPGVRGRSERRLSDVGIGYPAPPEPNRYLLTPEGVRAAAFYTKVRRRLLGRLSPPTNHPTPTEVRHALGVIDYAVDDYIANARIRPAA